VTPTTDADDLSNLVKSAYDLGAIRKSVEDATSVSGGLWLSYLFVLFYLAVAAGAVTHADLLLENPVKLPFLNIELPLLAFFFFAPLLFLVVHAYTMVHFVLLAKKAVRFHERLFEQFPGDSDRNSSIRDGLRRQLPSNIFVQFLAGPSEIRDSGFGRVLKLIAWTTLVFAPMALLLLFEIQFLPYHSALITWTHRVALMTDIAIVWWLWRKIIGGRGDLRGWRAWKTWAKASLALAASTCAFLFSWTVATFPGEWREAPLNWFAWVEPTQISAAIFNGRVDDITRRRQSWFSNTLVLPRFNLAEARKNELKDHSFDLRGRHLEGAVLSSANFGEKADLSGAYLNGAVLDAAELQRAKLDGAHLQGASLKDAELQRASFFSADLLGARLDNAQLQGASFFWAELQGASLEYAQLQGALLDAQMLGARLDNAQLQGARLDRAQLQGASLNNANFQGASLVNVFVWRATPPPAIVARIDQVQPGPKYLCRDAAKDHACDWPVDTFERLKRSIAEQVPQDDLRNEALARIERLDPMKPLQGEQEIASAWAAFSSASTELLADEWGAIGCDADDAPHVLRGLVTQWDLRYAYYPPAIERDSPEASALATRFLDQEHCAGARGLSEAERDQLRKIRDSPQASLNRGATYRAKGDLDRAIKEYDEAIRHDPRNADAYLVRGAAYQAKSDLARAIKDYDEAIRRDPRNADAFLIRGDAYQANSDLERAMKDYDEAIRLDDEAIRLDPSDAGAFHNRGTAYQAKGELERAIKDYDEAVRLDPSDAVALLNRGAAYRAKGELERAIKDYDEVVRLDPKNAMIYDIRGTTWETKGDPDRAIADYDQAIRLDAKFAEAYNGRCSARTKIGKLQAALADCNQSLALRPNDASTLDTRGFTYLKLGQLDDAIADFTAAIKIDAKLASSLYGRGVAKIKKGESGVGNTDIAAAKGIQANIADEIAAFGIPP
jgi:tetratricopeptide (TPR) repeat protein